MRFHKIAELFPLMNGEEFQLLCDDIKKEGLNNPVVLLEDEILDGRNRYRACTKISVEPKYKQFEGDDPLAFVLSENLHRRHLTASQRAALAAEVANMTWGGDRKSDQEAILPFEKTNKEASDLFQVGERYVKEAKAIKENYPSKFAELKTGNKTIQQAKREIVKENIRTKPDLPTDRHRVIYADPPWKYGNNQPDYQTEQADYYPLLDINEICAMDVKNIADDNAVLFLWATSPILEDAFKVINMWGFKYKASFVWDKIGHNMGHYNSVRHEFLLICTKGSCQPDTQKLFDSVQSIKRTKHSEKPEEFRGIIDTLYPYGKRIELFARKRIENWEAYGNQIS